MDPKALNALVHDHDAATYDDRFLIEVGPELGRSVRRELADALGTLPYAERLLDLACGTGYLAVGAALASCAREVHATDLSIQMCRRTQENAKAAARVLHLAVADAELLPYRDASFDLIVIRGALHHVPDPTAMLREAHRLLVRGGRVACLAEPTASGQRQVGAVVGAIYRGVEAIRRIRGHTRDAEHERWELANMASNLHTFSREDLRRHAKEAGFEDVRVGSSSWAWVLTLGVHYYLAGEFPARWARGPLRRVSNATVRAAAVTDRAIFDALVPERFHHTLWAVLLR